MRIFLDAERKLMQLSSLAASSAQHSDGDGEAARSTDGSLPVRLTSRREGGPQSAIWLHDSMKLGPSNPRALARRAASEQSRTVRKFPFLELLLLHIYTVLEIYNLCA